MDEKEEVIIEDPVAENSKNSAAPIVSEKKPETKKGCFIAGIVLFSLLLVTFIAILCCKGMIQDVLSAVKGADGENALAFIIVALFIIPVLIVGLGMFVVPLLGFTISSLVTLGIATKSCKKSYKIVSIIGVVLTVLLFLATFVIFTVWAMA